MTPRPLTARRARPGRTLRARRLVALLGAGVALGALFPAAPAGAATAPTTRVSVATSGAEANTDSGEAAISADGRFVAFASTATTLVDDDTNGVSDVFVRDRQAGTTTRVSLTTEGAEATRLLANSPFPHSSAPALSADGRFVAFESYGVFDSADVNNVRDVFVRDRDTDGNGAFDEAGAVRTTRVSTTGGDTPANGHSIDPAVSADGRFVAFESLASNLVAGDTNEAYDVFVHDRTTGTTALVSVDPLGVVGNGYSLDPAISDDGRLVAFESAATTLVAGDTNGTGDVFVRDRDTDGDKIFDVPGAVATTRASVASDGSQASGRSFAPALGAPALGAGRAQVAFVSAAADLVNGDTNSRYDAFVHHRDTGATTRVSLATHGAEANAHTRTVAIGGAGGRYVAFHTAASSLVANDTNETDDVFLRDRDADADGALDEDGAVATTRVSVDSEGDQAEGLSRFPALSADDGRYVAFVSTAPDLVEADTNGVADVFVRDHLATPVLLCGGLAPTLVGTEGNDLISGTSGRDVIVGLAGDDRIDGLKGDDVICGGAGRDTLVGWAGNDAIEGGGGDDTLSGGRGLDSLDGGAGTDDCVGGGGRRDTAVDCESVTGVP